MAAASRDEGWAFGREIGKNEYFILRRHGATWERAETLHSEKGTEFANTQMDASGPANVWMFASEFESAGEDTLTRSIALRWDGSGWQPVPVDFSVLDTAVLAPDDVWVLEATESPVARHWDGTRWTRHRLPGPAAALSASGPDDIWAVGSRTGQPAISHFDGEEWRTVTAPEQDGQAELTEVVAGSREDAWAFGSRRSTADGAGSAPRGSAFALHWDGTRWREAPEALDRSTDIRPFPTMAAAPDGAGGFVLGGGQHHTTDDGAHRIEGPKQITGRSAKGAKVDQRRPFEPSELQLVPGTREIWAVGDVSLAHSGKAGSKRGVVASYSGPERYHR
ncbi:hypothetical protein [Streptomyces sp. MAR4 CNX-425]|uniref:hypothetical protein n=1 Tax=Streptomyces sp. MAR4 CNX-425 TaxID=3406343 RepID=UPI003B50014F